MVSGVEPGRGDRPIDFFISYSPADERWATWLAWEFEAAGYRTMLQAWDFVPGTNFIDFMDRGVREAAFVIAVLSDRYLKSTYGRLEWQAALRADPLAASGLRGYDRYPDRASAPSIMVTAFARPYTATNEPKRGPFS